MALPSSSSSIMSIMLLLMLLVCSSPSSLAAPKALLAPVELDPSTNLYTVTLAKTSTVTGSSPLLLDLDGSNLWRDCLHPKPYSSPTLRKVRCKSAVCNAASVCSALICGRAGCFSCDAPPSPVCGNNSCSALISNSAISTSTSGLVWTDGIALPATNGRNPSERTVGLSSFAFACDDGLLLKQVKPPGVIGGAGMSRARLAIPSQVAAKASIKRSFAYCLPSSGGGDAAGVVFFGRPGAYSLLPGIDLTSLLQYTPLVTDTTQPDSYHISVTSISVGDTALSFDASLLKITKGDGSFSKGGTRISSTVRYSELHPSIYSALISAFKASSEARGIKSVPTVAPFDLCFDLSTAFFTRVGLNVPEIVLSLRGSGGVSWHIEGANSVVVVNDKVFCLAFKKTSEFESRSIIIGTYQQQNAFFEFDLATSRLGFLSTTLGLRTTCSNFNFTATNI